MTLKFHIATVRWLPSITQTTTNAGEDLKIKDHFTILMEMYISTITMEAVCGSSK
jgi:hypothetical protein